MQCGARGNTGHLMCPEPLCMQTLQGSVQHPFILQKESTLCIAPSVLKATAGSTSLMCLLFLKAGRTWFPSRWSFLSCVSVMCRSATADKCCCDLCHECKMLHTLVGLSKAEVSPQKCGPLGAGCLAVVLHIQPARTPECKIPHLGVRCKCCALLWGIPGL